MTIDDYDVSEFNKKSDHPKVSIFDEPEPPQTAKIVFKSKIPQIRKSPQPISRNEVMTTAITNANHKGQTAMSFIANRQSPINKNQKSNLNLNNV